MASLQGLMDDVMGWLNRRDIASLLPGWVSMVELDIAETLRARCMVKFGVQQLDNAYIALPVDFAAMESIRDNLTGDILHLKDEWSGSWTEDYRGHSDVDWQINSNAPSTNYRLLADCIEFLPHPTIPDPPDPSYNYQAVMMGWYAKPTPLVGASDTNAVLDQLYGVYLFGACKYGALFELDDDRAAQMDAQFQQVVTRANLWKQQSDYSGAPYRAEMAVVF